MVTSPSDSVALGDSGPGVKQVQTALVAHGFKVAADGTFGPQTKAAVISFQKANGLKADGVVGPATWTRLSGSSSSATTTTTKSTKKTATTTTATTTTKKPTTPTTTKPTTTVRATTTTKA